jgi:hypothetical protein
LSKFPVLGDAEHVLAAVRLGWGMAETRGRNRPDGRPGNDARLPADNDHALPLRIERSPTELRIEAQWLVAELAMELHVDKLPHGPSFGTEVDDQAKLLYHVRVPKVARALQAAVAALAGSGLSPAGPESPAAEGASSGEVAAALRELDAGVRIQQGVLAKRREAVAAAEAALAGAEQQLRDFAGQHGQEVFKAQQAVAAAQAVVRLEEQSQAAEQSGLDQLRELISTLRPAGKPVPDPQAAVAAIEALQARLTAAAMQRWAGPTGLAEVIWEFDAYIQDALAAASETRAMGYQLGRGLAETYWALDPQGPADGASGWSFLLGDERCAELSRLAGRLGAYMNEYTAPAIAGSVDVWKAVAASDTWRAGAADPALYNQIRRWYGLIVLGQDPTTLIKPNDIIKDYRTIGRTLKWFGPELAILLGGAAALGALIFFISTGGSTFVKTLFASLATVGLTAAGVAGKLKNSEQAMLTRLRQDAYTDLVSIAVQTAPAPPDPKMLRKALAQRQLTAATPN